MFIQLIRRFIPDSIFLWFKHESEASKFQALGVYPVSRNKLLARATKRPLVDQGLTEKQVRTSLLLDGGIKATKREVVGAKEIPNVQSYTRKGGR